MVLAKFLAPRVKPSAMVLVLTPTVTPTTAKHAVPSVLVELSVRLEHVPVLLASLSVEPFVLILQRIETTAVHAVLPVNRVSFV